MVINYWIILFAKVKDLRIIISDVIDI